MSWLVDNATTLSILFGLVAAALVLIWRTNRQNKYLAYAACAVGLICLIYLLRQFYISDSRQLERNVNGMADAVVAGKPDDVFKHVSKDFQYKGLTRDMLYKATQRSIAAHEVSRVRITSFRVEELSRDKKLARTSFIVTATANKEIVFRAETHFVLEGEKWMLKTMKFFPAIGGDQEIDLPGFQ